MLLIYSGASAQISTSAAGQEATGVGGTISATIGQPFYVEAFGEGYSIQEGVQQAYLITPLSTEDLGASIEMQVFPNPTTQNLTLTIREGFKDNLQYVLTDVQGKLIESSNLLYSTTEIDTDGLAAGTYLLRLSQGKDSLKTFKIVKQ